MSAGGVVVRQVGERTEVVLVGRQMPTTWGLPKGTPTSGESIEETALREVAEETGLRARLVAPIGAIQYYFVARNTRFHKTVHFYLMTADGGDTAGHDHEYDLVEWFALDEAITRLSYRNEAEIVRRARDILRAQPGDGHEDAAATGG